MAAKPVSSASDAVKKAVQKNIIALRNSVVDANILDKLFQEEVIDQNTYDEAASLGAILELSCTEADAAITAADAAITQKNLDGIGRQILSSVRKKLSNDANFFTEFCDILDKAHMTELSTKLKDDYEKQLTDAAGKAEPTLDISQVKQHLENLQCIICSDNSDAESKARLAQSVLRQFIKTSLQAGAQPGEVKQSLTHLCHIALMDKATFQWAVEEIDEIRKVLTAPATVFSAKAANVFTSVMDEHLTNTMYHAILCSHVVDNGGPTTDESLQFLNTALKDQHSIGEAAVCTPSTEVTTSKFLIAREGTTIYVSFQSNCSLSTWQKYKSFEEGLHQQSMDFPLRFFMEELWKGNSVIFTGFSFGGLLACMLAAKIWKLGGVDVDVLKNKLTCITFGQPQIFIRSIQKVAAEFPQFASTIHAVYLEEDTVPRILKFLNKSCEQSCIVATLVAVSGRRSLEAPLVTPSQPFEGTLSTYILQRLVDMESSTENHETLSLSLSELKGILMRMVPDLLRRGYQNDEMLEIASYMVLPRSGPTVRQASVAVSTWRKLNPEERRQQARYLGEAEIMGLDTDLLQKHNTSQYLEQICSSHLGKQATESRLAQKAAFLTPTVKEAELHHYDNKLAILLTGENLWFCHHIHVGAGQHPVNLPAVHHASGTFIQFDCPVTECEADRSNMEIDIRLDSYFPEREPGTKSIPIRAHKVYTINRREEQLAKLTPTELVELAYVSALLEQHHHDPQLSLSKRYEAIRNFLEEIVTVVPVESALSAIALAENDQVSKRCCKALMASKVVPPLSLMLYINTSLAIGRLQGRPYNAEAISPEDVYYSMWYAAKKIAGELKELEKTPSELGLERKTLGNAKYFGNTLESIFSIGGTRSDSEIRDMVAHLQELLKKALHSVDRVIPDALSGVSVNRFFQIHSTESKPPIEVLEDGRRKLTELQSQLVSGVRDVPIGDPEVSCTALYNTRMLELVERIRNHELKVCNTVLFSFLQEHVRIPMTEKNPMDLLKLFALGIAVGRRMIRSGQDVVFRNITVGEHIQSIIKDDSEIVEDRNNKYTAKIQFILHSIQENMSLNNDYPSYRYEQQLLDTIKRFTMIQPTASVSELVQNWDQLSTERVALKQVAESHRSLIARWMKCTLMIHSLRQELSKSTAVGVVGLVNSGKSQLVKTLFGVQVASGTRESKRTTVPFMYNLGPDVECLDVIDFPGADDQDPSIPALVNLLLSLAQLVVFVVDYRKAHTTAAKKWLISLSSVPVMVCLTHADKLYAEYMSEAGKHPPPAYVKDEMSTELWYIENKLGRSPKRRVDFYSFSQDADSVLNSEDGRQRLKEAGIKGAKDVGEWVAEQLETILQRPQIAKDLRRFVGI